MEDKAQELYKKKNKKLGIEKDVEPKAMWSFGLAMAHFVIVPIFANIPFDRVFFGIYASMGVLLGITSLTNIKENPKKFKGKGFAITGIIINLLFLLRRL